MNLAPLSFKCPKCGSTDVVYSCTPSCCFNHVCGHCYATFEPETTRVGEFTGQIPSLPEVDPAGPTAPCARCGEHRLFAVSDGAAAEEQLLCVSCGALLTLELKAD
jgi:transcription elongation factor Elf1